MNNYKLFRPFLDLQASSENNREKFSYEQLLNVRSVKITSLFGNMLSLIYYGSIMSNFMLKLQDRYCY